MEEQVNNHYLKLRRFLGIMGYALPLILTVGSYVQCSCGHIQNSISAYYYTPFVSVFCGLLVAIGVFLITYKGHETIDNVLTNMAGVLSVSIAVFPMRFTDAADACNNLRETVSCVIGNIHILSAGTFFLITATISCFVFTRTRKTKQQPPTTPQKIARNIIYIICGIVIYLCMAVLAANELKCINLQQYSPAYLFYFEGVMLFFFATSWLVKGETIFTDIDSALYNLLPSPAQKLLQRIADKY